MGELSCISVLCFVFIGCIGAAKIPVLGAHEVSKNFPVLAEDLDSTASQAALLNLAAGADKDYDQEDTELEDVGQELTQISSLSQQTRPMKYGFWTVHPSDLLPMRRLVRPNKRLNAFGIGKRAGSKKSQNPYHPIPRSVVIRNKQHDEQASEEEAELNESLSESEYSVQKRQSPGSYLLLKLSRANRPPPTNPSEGKSFTYDRRSDGKRS